jgi:hypothetical protein
MPEIKWIKIATDVFDNRKIRQIEQMKDGDGITEDMLSVEFHRQKTLIHRSLEVFRSYGMIDIIDNGIISLPSWDEHQSADRLEKIRKLDRQRKQRQRERQKQSYEESPGTSRDGPVTATGTNNVIVTPCAVDVTQQNKNKNKNIPPISPKGDIERFFESVWALYPNKKGKARISDSKKRDLELVGYERLKRCIERYIQGLELDGWRKAQNGSTFFNSGYVDYLDENYEPQEPQDQDGEDGPCLNEVRNE